MTIDRERKYLDGLISYDKETLELLKAREEAKFELEI